MKLFINIMLIGFENNSWGYHSNGEFYHEGKSYWKYGPEFATDDTIGCYLNFRNNDKTIFYTKNGVNLGKSR